MNDSDADRVPTLGVTSSPTVVRPGQSSHVSDHLPPAPVPPMPVPPKSTSSMPMVTNLPAIQATASVRTNGSVSASIASTFQGHSKRSSKKNSNAKVGKITGPVSAGALQAVELEQQRRVPSWLASFIVHLTLLFILALVPLSNLANGPLTLVFGNSGSDSLASFDLVGLGETAEVVEQEVLEAVPAESEPELLESLELPTLTTKQPSETKSDNAVEALASLPTGIRDGLTGRSGALKGALLDKFGGSAETEAAVEMGLQWLAKNQMSDGSWSLRGPYSDGGASENRSAATAMAINAFLGAGYTPVDGKYSENVRLGLGYLLRRQDKQGFFCAKEPSRQQAYAQALATIAMIEAAGMTHDSKYRVAAEKALEYAVWAQSDLKGWRYDPEERRDADMSVTGWYLMALVTGKMTHMPIKEEVLQSVTQFLDSVQYEQGSRYGYTAIEQGPTLSMTAEGLLCRIYLGWPRSHPSLLMAVRDDLLTNLPDSDDDVRSVYYWYYATQVLHHVGGAPWQQWNAAMKEALPALQEKSGKEAGSWDPHKDQFGASGGRLYTTCFTIYCLEVYYRHLAMYDLK